MDDRVIPREHRPSGEVVNKVEYLHDLEQDIPGAERDFFKAAINQSSERAKMGRAAILRMSHDLSPERGEWDNNFKRYIKWDRPPAPTSSGQTSKSAPEGFVFEHVEQFKEALEALPRRHDESAIPQFFDKQLIILEDLGRDWVETIGKAFHIPPRVFALHWTSPTFYRLGRARALLCQPAEEHFILPYSEILALKKIEDGGDYFKLDCSSVRFVYSDGQKDEEEATNQLLHEAVVSYWGRFEGCREWTAILLLDPQQGQPGRRGPYGIVRSNAKGEADDGITVRCSKAPPPDPRPALRGSHDESGWRPVILKALFDNNPKPMVWQPIEFVTPDVGTIASEPQPAIGTSGLIRGFSCEVPPNRSILREVPYNWHLSMFDQILWAPPPKPNFHPAHATKFVRRLVLAKMKLIVDIYLRQTRSLTAKAMQNISKIADFDPQRLSEEPWQGEWRSTFFNQLWELRSNIDLLGFDMENTFRLFSTLADNKSWPEMQNFDRNTGEEWDNEIQFGDIRIRDQDMEDLEEWKRLEATRKYAAGSIERTTNSYLQAATAEGAKFANIQARSSKKITFLATLFVPASLCAAVLALPGYSGAQGSSRFWLFWVVSVPIAGILAITLLFKDIRTYINEHWMKDELKKERPSKGSHGTRPTFSCFSHTEGT